MNTKTKRTLAAQRLKEGLLKHVGKTSVIVLKGTKHKVSDLLEMLDERTDAAKATDVAKAVWLQRAEEERTVRAETDAVFTLLREYVALVHGSSLDVLADFGIVPEARALTVAEKAAQVAKVQATRKARHTLGARQKEKVKGVGVEDAPPRPDPAPPSLPAPAHV